MAQKRGFVEQEFLRNYLRKNAGRDPPGAAQADERKQIKATIE
jgi:hypothetical protein